MFRRTLAILILCAFVLLLAGVAEAAKTHKGSVLSAVESKLMMLDRNDELMTLSVSDSAKIVLDGKPVALGALKPGDVVLVTIENINGIDTVVTIDAKTKA